jgi:two-component system response regulator HydG
MQSKKSLLIVDDDFAHRTMLRMLLNWQYEIYEADDGAAAIDEVNNRRFDLILMDIRMTKISGIEALDKIKSIRPDVPVVMMTACKSEEIADQTKNKGASGCLGKPFDFDELKQIIDQAISFLQPPQNAAV